MRGYRRLRAVGAEPGSSEIWRTALDHLDTRDGPEPVSVGHVLQAYERSAYVELDDAIAADVPTTGPTLLLLGGTSFTGPLATRVVSDSGRPFRWETLSAGEPCQVQEAAAPDTESGGVVFSVGSTLDIELDPTLVRGNTEPLTQADTISGESWPDIRTVTRDSQVWHRSRETLDWLAASEWTDGLEWAGALERAITDDRIGHEVNRLAADWTDAVSGASEAIFPETGVTILGRGPGATPSGDDILSGMLITLLRTTRDEMHERVRTVGNHLLEAARTRTTTISTALLAQAVKGRTSDPVERALEALVSGSLDRERREDTIATMTDLGHTSGVDMLLGMLITLLLVGPALAR